MKNLNELANLAVCILTVTLVIWLMQDMKIKTEKHNSLHAKVLEQREAIDSLTSATNDQQETLRLLLTMINNEMEQDDVRTTY